MSPFRIKRLTNHLLVGGLALILGACSVFSLPETTKETSKKTYVDGVYIYRYNKKIASIPGSFIIKKEKNYTSFNSEGSQNPILYQINLSNDIYLDCQEDKFNGNEFPINFGLETKILTLDTLQTPNQICRSLGYN